MTQDLFGAQKDLATAAGARRYFALNRLAETGVGHVDALPITIKILLEAALRDAGGAAVSREDVEALASWQAEPAAREVPFKPARVVLQDFTGVPAVVDLAALRDACRALGADPRRINPQVPCDLVIDHSIQVDHFGRPEALALNSAREFERNRERYTFLKWGQAAFDNFRVVPPSTGIVHQVNLEYLATVVAERDGTVFPDTVVGTDSHTTMIGGLGVVGWGVGGIEAEAVMLGQPIYMLLPRVVGFRLHGKLPEGATATDLVLTVTERLREAGVVGKFVEFFGPGLSAMSLPDRATIANMAPECGSTINFFPIDSVTLDYMRLSGREDAHVELVERYAKEQGLWHDPDSAAKFSQTVTLDLESVVPSLAGPKRPQDRIGLDDMQATWRRELAQGFSKPRPGTAAAGGGGVGVAAVGGGSRPASGSGSVAVEADPGYEGVDVDLDGERFALKHGAVTIAAITSCTNTSNPSVMVAAGLVARNARQRGLKTRPWVKTSLAPGSRVVTEYLGAAGLLDDLNAQRFNLVGYGCTTCIGNSGPLPAPISDAVRRHDLVVCSVLSGNRNFEGRIGPDIKANYLASPPLVVVYALTGTVDIDLVNEPLGRGTDGQPVYLHDIWPTTEQVRTLVQSSLTREQFRAKYADVFSGDEAWRAVEVTGGDLFDWQPDSTYVRRPTFFEGMGPSPSPITPIRQARVLAMLGDSVTTDHISPAGSIKPDSPAGAYLQRHSVPPAEFNSYGSRRGNHEVMMRGTFANVRLRNELAPGTEGGFTMHLPSGDQMTIFDAAMRYVQEGVSLVVIAGREYGSGSSRDWAAKGPFLQGVKAAIAESYERIHRSNLVGMGILPLQFKDGEGRAALGLTGHETFDIELGDDLAPRQEVEVTATAPDGQATTFVTQCRIDTPVEVDYYRNGGILHAVLRRLAAEA